MRWLLALILVLGVSLVVGVLLFARDLRDGVRPVDHRTNYHGF